MSRAADARLSSRIEPHRAALEEDPLSALAADILRRESGLPPDLEEALAVLDGGWSAAARDFSPRPLGRAEHDRMVIHPRERKESRHRLASLLSRVVLLIQGDERGSIIASATETATAERHPRLWRAVETCCKTVQLDRPPVHVARGRVPFFTVLLDGPPYLCVHNDFLEGQAALSDSALRFAIGHQLEHIKRGHAALLQLSPERLEEMILQEVPFLVRTPLKLATRAIGYTRVNRAAKKVGDWLPDESRSAKLFDAVGSILPDKDQETVLPEVVHDWVRSWLQGVEYSADRAGLLCAGSIGESVFAMLRLSPELSVRAGDLPTAGIRIILRESGGSDRNTPDRIRELLAFAVSRDYLARSAPG